MSNTHTGTEVERLRARVSAFLGRVGNEVRGRIPEHVEAGESMADPTALELFMNCKGIFEAICALLDVHRSHEASILSRTLWDDAILLAYMAKNPSKAEEIALRFEYQSLVDERGLWLEGSHFEGAAESLAAVERELESLRTLANERGVTKLRRLPGIAGVLNELGRRDLYFFYKQASYSVHTSRITLSHKVRRTGPRTVEFLMEGDVWHAAVAAGLASEPYLMSYSATAQMLHWPGYRGFAAARSILEEELLDLQEAAQDWARTDFAAEVQSKGS